MKTMPNLTLKVFRSAVEFMLTRIQAWEDKNIDPDRPDYRMQELNTGLWQASQSMKAIVEGDFRPTLHQIPLNELPQAAVLGMRYTEELLSGIPVPVRPVD